MLLHGQQQGRQACKNLLYQSEKTHELKKLKLFIEVVFCLPHWFLFSFVLMFFVYITAHSADIFNF